MRLEVHQQLAPATVVPSKAPISRRWEQSCPFQPYAIFQWDLPADRSRMSVTCDDVGESAGDAHAVAQWRAGQNATLAGTKLRCWLSCTVARRADTVL